MKKLDLSPGSIPITFAALIGGASLMAAIMVAVSSTETTNMSLVPAVEKIAIGESVDIDVVISSEVPVNAFTGEVLFDKNVFTVESISYNTEVADLWVTEPWYSKADNTVYFAGGTTKSGGFVGKDNLLTITLKASNSGYVMTKLKNHRILLHDGFGTDATLPASADVLLSFYTPDESKPVATTWVQVGEAKPSTDLNNDGKQSLADIAIMMLHIGGNNKRYDFNQDGLVNTTDFSILMNAK